jgi:hypothetical protein
MNPDLARRLVRGWVALYTRGLPADVRMNRSDEIESDLWSHAEDAGSSGETDSALAKAILTRWVLGVGADLAWRLERGQLANRTMERTTTMGTQIIALLAIVGGVGMAIAVANWAVVDLGNPRAHDWEKDGWTLVAFAGAASIVALSLALGGLGIIFLYRYDSPVGLVAELGVLSVLGLIGAYSALILLPVASVAVILYLARIHAVGWSLAAIHVASAPGLVLGLAAYADLVGISAVLILAYCGTCTVLGLELLRGLPVSQVAAPSATNVPSR